MAKAGTASSPGRVTNELSGRGGSELGAAAQPSTPSTTSHTSRPSELLKVTTAGAADGAGVTSPLTSYHCRTGRTE